MSYLKSPQGIERRSFEIIREELGPRSWSREEERIITRIIHTTADFSFAEATEISPGAVESAMKALREGARLVTDTNMARAGINKTALERFGGKVSCCMAWQRVARLAAERGTTRAAVSMRLAAKDRRNRIYVIGNAPTALFELKAMIEEGITRPDLVIGVPVGFVGAMESKEAIREAGVPYIVTRGRRGGSSVAAAIVNALLYLAGEDHA
ncbi:MAG: precorrin-8X methylmutase [Firmicutes bacterium]|nr:precorrin-8X methylmutase [Bacillota bacterium]